MKTTTSVSRLKIALALLAAIALGGCAATRSIDSDVQSFAGTQSVAKGATYTFERLPSQQADPAAQAGRSANGSGLSARRPEQSAKGRCRFGQALSP